LEHTGDQPTTTPSRDGGPLRLHIGVMHGDDIGPEIVPEAVSALEASVAPEPGVDIEFHHFPVGWTSYLEHGRTLPPSTLEGLATMNGFILGPIGHAAYPKDDPESVNPHPIIRKHFDLYANLRPVKSNASLSQTRQDIDLLVVRENNEGFQPDRNMLAGCGEFQPNEESAFSLRVITRRQSERIAHAAFAAARRRDRRRLVTAIHKRSVFKLTDGLFMDTVDRVGRDYPDIALDNYQVDTFAMHLVMRPQDFDVILCTNLFGDILSDEAAGLVGGLGMAPGLNAGDDLAMAQATHGSAPDIAGKGVANPYAMIISSRMLLEWLAEKYNHDGLKRAVRRIDTAVDLTIADGSHLTPDIGGTGSTHEMGAAIAQACGKLGLEPEKEG
jgi:3-isopropylmalate dehydrogenase